MEAVERVWSVNVLERKILYVGVSEFSQHPSKRLVGKTPYLFNFERREFRKQTEHNKGEQLDLESEIFFFLPKKKKNPFLYSKYLRAFKNSILNTFDLN